MKFLNYAEAVEAGDALRVEQIKGEAFELAYTRACELTSLECYDFEPTYDLLYAEFLGSM